MKQIFSLLLVLVLCLTFCSCGSNDDKMPDSGFKDTSNSDNLLPPADGEGNQNEQSNAFLHGRWTTYNGVYRFDLFEDGKGADTWEQETAWSLTDDLLTIDHKGQMVPGSVAGEFNVVYANGFYYLIKDAYTFVREDALDSIPITQVELSTENCMEYLELVEVNKEIKDAFGEPTGKYDSYVYLAVKNAYRYTRNGNIAVRYLDGTEDEAVINEGDFRVLVYSKPFNEGIRTIEIVEIQGTLGLFDGI